MAGEDMITKYLASRGATPSAENASRVRQHYASNPDLLDRRASGLPGGLDDNSSVLDAYLDKQIAESMPAPIPQGSVEVGQPVKANAAPAPSRAGPTTQQPMAKQVYPPPKEAIGAPNNIKTADQGSAPVDKPQLSGSVNEQGMPVEYDNRSGSDAGIGKFLLSLLGIGSAAGAASMRPAGAPAARGGAPAPTGAPLPGSTSQMSTPVPGYEIPAPYGTDVKTPASNVPVAGSTSVPGEQAARNDLNRQMIERQIEIDNDAMQRQMEQDARNRRVQQGANDTANAAKRLFRR